MRLHVAIIVVLLLVCSCAWFQRALHTAADAARVLCELWAEEQGGERVLKLSPADFCAVADNVRPFLDATLAAKQQAGQTVGARVGLHP